MPESPTSSRKNGWSDEIALVDVVRFLSRYRWLIIGSGMAAGLLTALVILFFVPHTYEASATLVVVPPKFSSELMPQTLTIQGYQKLLESDAAIAETKQRLVESGDINPSMDLRVGHNLHTRIFVSRRSEETELAPMIQLDARFESPEVAVKVANTWAKVFLERTHDLMGGTTSATVQLIDQQYAQAKDLLAGVEQQRVNSENAYQKRYDEVQTKWDREITRFKNETSEKVATYQAETRRLREEFTGDHSIDTRSAQVDALRSAYHDLQNEQARVESQLDQKTLQLEASRKQLEGTPQYLTLHKAITDDALWEATAASGKQPPNLDDLSNKTLATQEINPVYIELSSRAASIEMDLNALVPRAKQLSTRLTTMAQQLQTLDSALRSDNAALEKLDREREAGLEILQDERTLQTAILERQKKQELDTIDRENTAHLAQLTRGVDQQQQLFQELAQNYNEATLAKAQQTVEDVRLGAAAVSPSTAVPRGVALKTLAAAVLGSCLGLCIAAFRALDTTPTSDRPEAHDRS